jgi:homoserine kinase type II
VNSSAELDAILENYDLGNLVDFERDVRGTVNTSYTIVMEKDGLRRKYFLRRYKDWIKKEELEFEHSLINHLVAKDFDLVARVIPTRAGGTYLHRFQAEGDPNGVYYAIFDFLSGEDRFTWIAPHCNPAEITSSAEVLAGFHQRTSGFTPQGVRLEPRIADLLPVIEANILDCARITRKNVFEDYLHQNLNLILDDLQLTRQALDRWRIARLPELVVHCDFHPGNLKYAAGRAVGLFDFDWSKVDYRCYDVALGLFYFFVSWEYGQDGGVRLEEAGQFLKAYQSAMAPHAMPGPLTSQELQALPAMLHAANLYVLNWAVLDYIRKPVDPDEYLVCLQHGTNTIFWLNQEDHQIAMAKEFSHLDILRR